MADGTVTINLDLNTDHIMSDTEVVKDAFKNLGADIDTTTIEQKFNDAFNHLENKADAMIDNINDKTVNVKVKANDTTLKEKVSEAVNLLSKLPEEKRTQLIAELHKQGFNGFRELLEYIPKEKHTELLADIQAGNINKFNSLINHVKKEKITELKAKDDSKGVKEFDNKLDTIPKEKTTQLKVKDAASTPIEHISEREGEAVTKTHTLKDVMMGTFAGGLIQSGITAITNGIREMTRAGEEYNVQQDTMRINWENLTREAPQDGKNMVSMINEFAQHSIYSAEALDKMAQSFYHVHSNAQETKQWTQDFINLGSTLHVSNEALSETAEQFAKVEAGGKANAMDMQMMINRFPMFGEALEKATGKSMAQLYQLSAQGKLTSKVFSQALDYLGNKYKSSQAEAMTSFQGMSMHLRSQFSVLSGDIMKSSFNMSKSTLAAIQKITDDRSMQTYANLISQAFAEVMSGVSKVILYISNHKDDIMAVIKNIASIAGTFGGAIWNTIKSIINDIASAFNNLSGNAQKSSSPLKNVANALSDLAKHKNAIKSLASVLLGLFVTKKALSFAKGLTKVVSGLKDVKLVISTLGGPMSLVIAGIAGLSVAFIGLYKNNAKFRHFVDGLVKSAHNFFKSGVKWFKNAFKSIGNFFKGTTKWERDFTKSLNNMLKGVINWGKGVGTNVNSAIHNMKNIVIDGMRIINREWTHIWSSIGNFIHKIWNNIITWVKRYIDLVAKSIHNRLLFIQNIWNSIWKAISDFIIPIWNDIKKIVSNAINHVHDTISDVLGKISSVWNKAWSGISSFFKGIWRDIKKAAQDGINGVLHIINAGIDGIDSVWKFFTGHETSIHHLKPVHFEQGGIVDRHLSMVNDGAGPDWKELIETPDGQLMMSSERNAILPLEPGTRVYNGAETKAIMNMMGVEHYANGGVVGNVINWGAHELKDFGSWIKDKWDAITKFLSHPIENTKAIIKKAIDGPIAKLGNSNMGDLARGVFNKLTKPISDWFKKGLQKAKDEHDAESSGGGAGVTMSNAGAHSGSWAGDIRKIADEMHVHVSDSDMQALLHRIAKESGGDQSVRQKVWDVNMANGDPAMGLFQYIPPTFAAWSVPGHTNILSGDDQIRAVFNDSNWRSDIRMPGGWGPTGHRVFGNGGHVLKPEYALIGEQGDEFVINPRKPSTEALLMQAAQERLTYNSNSIVAKAISNMNSAKLMNGSVAPTISYANNSAINTAVDNKQSNINNKDVNVSFVIDGRTVAQKTFPFIKMMQSSDITLQSRKGAY